MLTKDMLQQRAVQMRRQAESLETQGRQCLEQAQQARGAEAMCRQLLADCERQEAESKRAAEDVQSLRNGLLPENAEPVRD